MKVRTELVTDRRTGIIGLGLLAAFSLVSLMVENHTVLFRCFLVLIVVGGVLSFRSKERQGSGTLLAETTTMSWTFVLMLTAVMYGYTIGREFFPVEWFPYVAITAIPASVLVTLLTRKQVYFWSIPALMTLLVGTLMVAGTQLLVLVNKLEGPAVSITALIITVIISLLVAQWTQGGEENKSRQVNGERSANGVMIADALGVFVSMTLSGFDWVPAVVLFFCSFYLIGYILWRLALEGQHK